MPFALPPLDLGSVLSPKSRWQAAEIEDFATHAQLPLRVSSISDEGFPHITSLWFHYVEGRFFCCTQRSAQVSLHLRRNPRVGFELAVNAPPYRGLSGVGTARVLVVVDNLQAIAVEPPHGKPWASDMDRDRAVIEGLTRMQHELADPVMVVSEVTKGTFTNTDAMASILGTGRNTYRADAVMLLKRVENSDTGVDLIIDKGRDGMERGKVSLEWDQHYTRLSEVGR
jgi:hypothetical protein